MKVIEYFFDKVAPILIVAITVLILFSLLNCMSMPDVKDYSIEERPCYYADICIRSNAIAKANVQDCTIAIQKCFRYLDDNKCGKDKDCWDRIGVRN